MPTKTVKDYFIDLSKIRVFSVLFIRFEMNNIIFIESYGIMIKT